jgi:phage terminase large subunit-like protein
MNEPRLLLPPMDAEPWPTLGLQVADWIEAFLVHGPGDVRGQPIALTEEELVFLCRAYEVYPQAHQLAGRRRFKRAVLSRRKGWRKTELAAWIAIAEMDPTAPIRCDGFDAAGEPVGRSILDPYIPMVSTTEEQSEDLGYGAARTILENCELGNFYDIGVERIMHRDVPGEMKALASAPSARDGARTSFQHFDETHLFISERLKNAQATMLRNVGKRKEADPWSLETTTMYGPGEESVAEASHLYAEQIRAGTVEDPRLLFDHRQASETHDLETKSGLRAAIVEASGDAIGFTDVENIASQYREAAANRDERAKNEFRRYWLNQRRTLGGRAFPPELWDQRAVPGREIDAPVVLAFDGSYNRDSTALVGCTVEERPYIFVVAAWERPPRNPHWRTPRSEVESELERAMEDYTVLELAPDPPGWHHEIENWEQLYGETVVRFETNQATRMGPACDEFTQALRDDEFDHDGDLRLARHVGHCVTAQRGRQLVVTKESPDSPLKIDLAVGAIIAFTRARWHVRNPMTAAANWSFH